MRRFGRESQGNCHPRILIVSSCAECRGDEGVCGGCFGVFGDLLLVPNVDAEVACPFVVRGACLCINMELLYLCTLGWSNARANEGADQQCKERSNHTETNW